MLKFYVDDKVLYAGRLKGIGLVIYDPLKQEGVHSQCVRLYEYRTRNFSIYSKSFTREHMSKITQREECLGAIQYYKERVIERKRYTHCFACKKYINSIEDKTCSVCQGIVCSCGACFCDRHSHKSDKTAIL